LLREPASGPGVNYFDKAYTRAVWRSGVTYRQLFRAVVIHRLEPGDLLIQNNLTWAHAASNWTPGSGIRNVIAAFA
jgi:alpha-ketoglutarate-dependent taurine dioxygenase